MTNNLPGAAYLTDSKWVIETNCWSEIESIENKTVSRKNRPKKGKLFAQNAAVLDDKP